MDDLAGKTVKHYEILERIGRGGMGVVYRAKDTHLLRDVAIKILPTDLVADEQVRNRFISEARTASAIKHPNICTVHDIGDEEGVLFIVMELIEGKTLRQMLDERNVLPEAEVVDIAVKVSDALLAAHDQGIVHRDIKPDNIMISREGYVKVMDFGLAKLAEDRAEAASKAAMERIGRTKSEDMASREFSTTLSGILGTVAYMSPEQAQGKPVNAQSDIFSLGVVLFELLSGDLPFRGESNLTTLTKISDNTQTPVLRSSKSISQRLAKMVNRMLMKNRNKRYADLHEPIKVLESLKDRWAEEIRLRWLRFLGLALVPRRYRPLAVTAAIMLFAALAYFAVSITTTSEVAEAEPYPFLFKFGSEGKGDGQFNRPQGIARDKDGNIVVVDQANHRVEVFDLTGKYLFEFGSFGAADGQFNQPTDVAVNSADNILVTDTFNHRIQVFDPSGDFLFKFGSGCLVGIDPDCIDPDGEGPLEVGDGQFDRPYGIAVDGSDNIVVTDHFNHRIQVFDSSGNFQFKFGSPCYISTGELCVDPDDSGPLDLGDGQFINPSGIAVDGLGNMIVLELQNSRIQVFDSNGEFLFKFGSAGSGEGQFNGPTGLAWDSDGNIIVTDTGNNRVQVFDSSGDYLFQFGFHGSGEGNLNNPAKVLMDDYGNMLISDAYNHRLQVFGRPIFSDITSLVGISASGHDGFGFFDFDNDDDLDLFVQSNSAPSLLYQNNGKTNRFSFTEQSASIGIVNLNQSGKLGLVDYNNDGFVDIFIANYGPNILFENKKNQTFTDMSTISGVTDTNKTASQAFGDYDNNGYLDLYVVNDTSTAAILYKNSGSREWKFEDVTVEARVGFKGWAHGCVFVDYDSDGDQDIYISTYYGNNVLYQNTGNGTFRDMAPQAGLAIGDRSRGTVFGDYDNDGDLDLYVTRGVFHTAYGNLLFRNEGPPNWTFREVSSEAGVGHPGDGTNSAFGDYDNDGDLDLYAANATNQANALYRNNGDGTFSNITQLAGVANPLNCWLAVFIDYNNDGSLDIYAGNSDGPHSLYENRGNTNHWLKIKLAGTTSNRDGFGSRILVTTAALTQMRHVDGGNPGAGFQSSIPVHFGLGTAEIIDRIEVKWPSGIVSILTDMAPNQTLTIVEGET